MVVLNKNLKHPRTLGDMSIGRNWAESVKLRWFLGDIGKFADIETLVYITNRALNSVTISAQKHNRSIEQTFLIKSYCLLLKASINNLKVH